MKLKVKQILNNVRRTAGAAGLRLSLAALLAVAGTTTIMADDAPPEPPHRIYGEVTVNGSTAGPGFSVRASISGGDSVSDNTEANGMYDLTIDGEPGDSIVLSVEGQNAGSTTYERGGAERIDLSVNMDYTLTVSSGAGGSVTSPGEGSFTYSPGTVVTLAASADSGYAFLTWSGDVADSGSSSTTVTMDGNKSVSASFYSTSGPPSTSDETFILTVDSTEGGSVTEPGEGEYEYDEDETAELTATPDEGYEFTGWTGDDVEDADESSTTIEMDEDKSVTANFIPSTYTLSVSSGSGGAVLTPGEGEFEYSYGTTVNLTAAAEEGYEFAGWTGDVADADSAATTLVIDGNKSVSASFTQISYTLDISSGAGGTVTVPGEGQYDYGAGEEVSVTASPLQGYKFAGWNGDVADSSSAATTITMDGDQAITASFEAATTTPTTTQPDDDGEMDPAMVGLFTGIGAGLVVVFLGFFLLRRRYN